MASDVRRSSWCWAFFLALVLWPMSAGATASFTYDEVGRLTTAVYDNGLCLGYSYDANGNRTGVSTLTTSTQAPTWGTPTWGCFPWTP
jgi:YD repeat-containing protein